MSLDPLKDIWRQDFEREVEEALAAFQTSKPDVPSRPFTLAESVIPKAATVRELEIMRDRLGSLEPLVSDLKRQHDLRTLQLEEELRRRDRLKDVIVRLNLSLRRLERDSEQAEQRLSTQQSETAGLQEKLLAGEAARLELQKALAASQEEKLKGLERSAELEARLDEISLLHEQKAAALRRLEARLELSSQDHLKAHEAREAQLHASQREVLEKEARIKDLREQLGEIEGRHFKDKTVLEVEAANLKKEISELREQVRQSLAVADELALRKEDISRLSLENQSLRETSQSSHAAAARLSRAQEDLRNYETELNDRMLSQMKTLREERQALYAEVQRTMRGAAELKDQAALSLEQAQRRVIDAAHEEALAGESARDAVSKALERFSSLQNDSALAHQEEMRKILERYGRIEAEFAAREAEIKREREAEQTKLQAASTRLREEEVFARRELESERQRLRAEAQATLREVQRLEDERKSFEAEKPVLLEREKEIMRKAFEASLEKARLEMEVEKSRLAASVEESRGARQLLEAKIGELTRLMDQSQERARAFERQAESMKSVLASALEAEKASAESARLKEAAVRTQYELDRKLMTDEREAFDRRISAAKSELEESVKAQSRLDQKAAELGLALEAAAKERLERGQKDMQAARAEAAARTATLPPAAPPRPVRRAARVFSTLLICAGLLAAGTSAWRRHNAPRVYQVPFSHPTALVWRDSELWASDWYEEAVYRLRLEGGQLKIVRRYPLPGVHITGMAVASDYLYLADSWKREIQRRILDESLSLESAYPSPGDNPTGLYCDGKYLWSADGAGTIYRHLTDLNLTVLNAYPSNYPAVAIDSDADKLWTADSKQRLIYARRRDNFLTLIGARGGKEMEEGTFPLSSFARREDRLWIGRDGSNTLLDMPWRRLEERPIPPHTGR